MGNSRANIRIISLILVIVMSMLTLVGCLPDMGDETDHGGSGNNNTGNNSDGNEGGNNNNPDNGTGDSHTCSFGDWVIIKSATATEDGLCERYCECGNIEQKIIPASVKEYTITYIDAPQHNNPTKYTVNDFIDLQAAVWNGLSFAYWTDKDGNIIEEIPYGTEGNITLYANWRLTENLTISNSKNDPELSVYDDVDNRYYFIYSVGVMTDVVLDQLSSYKYKGGTSHTWTISETVSFTEANAENISNTISNSVTSSSTWNSATSAAVSRSKSTSSEISSTISAEIGVEGFGKMGGSMSASMGVNVNNSSSLAATNSVGGSSGSSSSSSKSVTSTISFETDTTTQITRSETLDPSATPVGVYKYVQAAEILVFAIVTYDVDSEDYFIDIFSVVQDVYDTMLYEPLPEEINNLRMVEHEPFAFNIDIDYLADEVIGNSYYIDYDSNGGEGEMPTQMVLPETPTKLLDNKFTKEGSLFVGWRVKDGDKTAIYMDGQSIEDLGSPKETVTLEAIWTSDPEYDKDVVYTLTTKSGTVSQYTAGVRPGINYSAKIEYRNRTADSIEIKITWTTTRTNGWTSYGQNVKLSVGSVTSGTMQLVSYNGWGQSSSNKTATKDTGWMTVPLNTSAATTINLKVQYWQTNSNGNDMTNSSDPTKALNTTWTLDIPAAK